MTPFDQAINLICNTRRVDLNQTGPCLALMKEFLRREALWAKELGVADQLPFADLSLPFSKIDHARNYSEHIASFTCSVAESRCCSAMLNWYGQVNSCPPAIPALRLPDPYLPLLQFFRLGGTFSREHRVFVDVNRKMTIQANMVQNGDLKEPFVILED